MKTLLGILFAVAMLATPVSAAPLSKMDESYVIAVIGATIISDQCHVAVVENGAVALSDKTGVDRETIGRALAAAVKANAHMPYERGDLIPEVTTTMINTMIEINGNLKVDHNATCNIWVNGLRMIGILK